MYSKEPTENVELDTIMKVHINVTISQLLFPCSVIMILNNLGLYPYIRII